MQQTRHEPSKTVQRIFLHLTKSVIPNRRSVDKDPTRSMHPGPRRNSLVNFEAEDSGLDLSLGRLIKSSTAR